MTVDRLTDAGHDFLQMMFGYGLDGAAAGEIGERPDDEREVSTSATYGTVRTCRSER